MANKIAEKIRMFFCPHDDLVLVIDWNELNNQTEKPLKCKGCGREIKIELTSFGITEMAPKSTCWKKRYESKRAAQTVKNIVQSKNRGKKQPTRVYECPRCHGWHMTSKG